jgi:cystathionine beta-lyase family protein involved in aluminum resistance
MINVDLFIKECENKAKKEFDIIDDIALSNQKKVLDAFAKNRISAIHFNPSSGYGYDDAGRNALNRLFADVFNAESAIVSPLIANGTHALTLALFGILRPGDFLLSITGKPYDTLDDVIAGKNNGSLADFGISYKGIELIEKGEFDFEAIGNAVKTYRPKLVFIQRSKGYAWRDALDVSSIGKAAEFVKSIDKDIVVMVDNCYGEFVETKEPTQVGADICVGSLIKNAGGGIAPTGGYIVGKNACIEQISYRLTAPSLGLEVGSCISGYLPYFEGLFLAPSTVKNALKGNVLAGYALSGFGYETMPAAGDMPHDIIKSIKFNTADELIGFCRLIQKFSPVDSYVTLEPWDMPGYAHQVIMAAGTFVQGASLELSADGTVREPYVAYLQGGLTYEHCKIAVGEIIKYFDGNINK